VACVLRLHIRTLGHFGGERVLPATVNGLLQPSGARAAEKTPVWAPFP
jgi:hypothetical protein